MGHKNKPTGPKFAGALVRMLQNTRGQINPNQQIQPQPINKLANLTRGIPNEPAMGIGMGNQYMDDPRNAVNYMQQQGMAKTGSIGPAQGLSGYTEGNSEKNENKNNKKSENKNSEIKRKTQIKDEKDESKKAGKKSKRQIRLEKTKAKAEKARKETTAKETADKGVVGDGTRSKTQQKRAKTKRLEKRVKRQEGRQERREIRKKAREGKMTRGEKRQAIIDSRDKQKGKKKK